MRSSSNHTTVPASASASRAVSPPPVSSCSGDLALTLPAAMRATSCRRRPAALVGQDECAYYSVCMPTCTCTSVPSPKLSTAQSPYPPQRRPIARPCFAALYHPTSPHTPVPVFVRCPLPSHPTLPWRACRTMGVCLHACMHLLCTWARRGRCWPLPWQPCRASPPPRREGRKRAGQSGSCACMQQAW